MQASTTQLAPDEVIILDNSYRPSSRGAFDILTSLGFRYLTIPGLAPIAGVFSATIVFYRDDNWLVRVNLLHAFAQNDIAEFETATDGYNLLKAEISYTKRLPNAPLGAPREFTVGVVGNNLLNEDIRNHVSYTKDEVLMPGASVRAFANVKF